MSKNLGPIHYMMYNKVRFQNELCHKLLAKFKNVDMNEFNETIGQPQSGELSEIIELSNIHGWLQGNVDKVELKLAYIVKKLQENGVNQTDIEKVAFEHGKTARVEANTKEEAWNSLNVILINGMPCDRVLSFDVSDDKFLVKVEKSIHDVYWEQIGVINNIYNEIRNSIIEGALEGTKFDLNEINSETFEIVMK